MLSMWKRKEKKREIKDTQNLWYSTHLLRIRGERKKEFQGFSGDDPLETAEKIRSDPEKVYD